MKVFEDAALLAAGKPLDPDDAARATTLLSRLGFDPVPARDAHLARIFGTAARMARVFEMRSPYAPGLACVGATVEPSAYGLSYPAADVSGRGSDMAQAFASCVGEGVEHLSHLAWGDERLVEVSAKDCLASLSGPTASAMADMLQGIGLAGADRLPGTRTRLLVSGREAPLPAALCYRAADGLAIASRTGCAAAATLRDACLSALLELVERDAAALWWIGGRQPRAIGAEALAAGAIGELTATLRDGGDDRCTEDRRTWLLDITTDLGVPCAAAVSTDRDGRAFACGLAARPTLGAAASAAFLELCQMELAHHLVAEKLKRGATLTPADRRHKARFEGIIPEACGPLFAARPPAESARGSSDGTDLDRVAARLRHHDLECFIIDLTRPAIGIPCARALAPALQPLPATWTTRRLSDAIAETGGGARYTKGLDLL